MICRLNNVRTVRSLSDGKFGVTHIQTSTTDALGELYACSLKLRGRGKVEVADVLNAFCSQANEALELLNQNYIELNRPVRVDDVVDGQPCVYFEIWVEDLIVSVKNTINAGYSRGDGLSTEQQLENTCNIVMQTITRGNPKE